MQILITIFLILIFLGFVIYKINGQFKKKEIIIFISLVIVTAVVFTMYQKNQKEYLPNVFKAKYEKQNGVEISKLSYELLNNKVVSSKNNYVYKFTYLVQKEGKEFLCTINNLKIQKVQDEFIFDKWKEECTEK